MRSLFIPFGVAFGLTSSLLVGCGSSSSPPVVSSPPASPTASVSPAAPAATPAPANLKTYDDPVMAIATQHPSNMTVGANCSSEGCGYLFKLPPQNNALDDAEVQIFLPAGVGTAAEVKADVSGENGLLKSNGWTVVSGAQPPQEWLYPWVKEIITFSTDQEMTGYLLVGETNGQGLRATILYPSEMPGAFTPAAKTILDNLRFKPDKLPITTQG